MSTQFNRSNIRAGSPSFIDVVLFPTSIYLLILSIYNTSLRSITIYTFMYYKSLSTSKSDLVGSVIENSFLVLIVRFSEYKYGIILISWRPLTNIP